MDKFSFLYRHGQVRVLLLCAVIVVALSYLRAATAGSIMVDYHSIGGVPLWITFAGLLTIVAFSSLAVYRLWRDQDLSAAQVRIATYALIAIYSGMLPMLSNDLFSLLAYGDAVNRGADVYTDTNSLATSRFYEYVSPLWRHAPCVYGPVSLGTSRLAALVADGNIYLAILVYKVLAALWACVFVECMVRISEVLHLRARMLALVLFNPILMIEGIGQLHCDGIAIALAAAMIYSLVSGRWYAAFIWVGLAICAKMSYVLMLPFVAGGLYIYKNSWSQLLLRMMSGVVITFVIIVLLYLPYYSSPRTFSVPFDFLTHQNPAKSAAEIIGDVVYFAPGVLLGENAELHESIKRPSGVSDGQLRSWLAVKKTLQIGAVLTSMGVLLFFWRGRRTFLDWCRTYVRLLLLFLLFYSHVLYPWYLLFILPLLLDEADAGFVQWLLVMLALAIVQDTMTFTQRETLPYYSILILTFSSIMSFFWRFRTVYFRSLSA